MSSYRDDTQETIVLSSDAFGKTTSGDVENFSFTETILSKVRHNVEEIIRLGDEDLSRRKGRLDSELGFADQVIHSVRKFQLIEEVFILADHSFVKQSELITEDLGLGEVEQVSYKAVHIEPFKVADAHFTYKTAFQSISDRLKLSDSLHALSRSSDLIEESLVLSDSTRDKLKTLIVETLGLGQELEALQERLWRGSGERLGVLHHEILGHIAFTARQTLALNANDLQPQAARCGNLVVQNVTRVGGKAHHHRQCARDGKGALCQRRSKTVEHRDMTPYQPVSLGVHATQRVAAVFERRVQNTAHHLGQLAAGLLLVIGHLLE